MLCFNKQPVYQPSRLYKHCTYRGETWGRANLTWTLKKPPICNFLKSIVIHFHHHVLGHNLYSSSKMTLIPCICSPQAVIIVILGNFITQKIVRAESWPRGALIFSSPTTGMASHPLGWLTLGQCHLSERNLELSLSDFNLSPHPIIQVLIPWNRYFIVIIRPWQVPQAISPFLILLASVHLEAGTHFHPRPLFLCHSGLAKLKSSPISLFLEYKKCLKKRK